jgi:hypothetical protein
VRISATVVCSDEVTKFTNSSHLSSPLQNHAIMASLADDVASVLSSRQTEKNLHDPAFLIADLPCLFHF